MTVEVGIERADVDAVFVDLDNTLVKGSALFHVGRGLVASGVINPSDMARLVAGHALYRLLGEHPRRVESAQRRGLAMAAGLPEEHILGALDRLYDEYVAPRLWPGTVRLLEAHRAANTPVWLATAAPIRLASLIAERLGLSGALGTRVESSGGVFTGRMDGPPLHGLAKARAVVDLAAEHGWSLARCVAYSDSTADLPLLTAVGHPAVINPEHALKCMAVDHHWPVYDFRARRWTARVGGQARIARPPDGLEADRPAGTPRLRASVSSLAVVSR